MAHMYLEELKKYNAKISIFGFSKVWKNVYSTQRLEDFSGVDIIVYGWGWAFLTQKDISDRNKEFESDIEKLCDLAERNNIPLILSSVGGDENNKLNPVRARLWKIASFTTFRNESDTNLYSGYKNEYKIFPDVVWGVEQFFFKKKRDKCGVIIGFDKSLINRKIWKILLVLTSLIWKILRREYKIVFLDTDNYLKTKYWGSIKNFIEEINCVDLLITHRLHMGIVAMSYGIPVLQFMPQRKSKILFKSIWLSKMIFDDLTGLYRITVFLSQKNMIEKAKKELRKANTYILKKESRGHFLQLKKYIYKLKNGKNN